MNKKYFLTYALGFFYAVSLWGGELAFFVNIKENDKRYDVYKLESDGKLGAVAQNTTGLEHMQQKASLYYSGNDWWLFTGKPLDDNEVPDRTKMQKIDVTHPALQNVLKNMKLESEKRDHQILIKNVKTNAPGKYYEITSCRDLSSTRHYILLGGLGVVGIVLLLALRHYFYKN